MLYKGRVKRIWYLSPMRAAKVQASLRIRAVSPEPLLLAHISSESRGTFRQKAKSMASLNGWTCAVKICHDGMLEDTNSLDASHKVTAFNVLPFSLVNAYATFCRMPSVCWVGKTLKTIFCDTVRHGKGACTRFMKYLSGLTVKPSKYMYIIGYFQLHVCTFGRNVKKSLHSREILSMKDLYRTILCIMYFVGKDVSVISRNLKPIPYFLGGFLF